MKTFRILGVAFFAVFAVCVLDVVAAAPAMAEEVCVELFVETSLWLEATCGVKLVEANSLFELVTFLLALWLRNGEEITAELPTESSGELLLEDIAAGIGVLCSGLLDGTVGANSADLISELLNLEGVLVKELEAASALKCVTQKGTCTEPLVWAANLPWPTEVELWQTETALIHNSTSGFVVLILPHAGGGNPGWEVECMNAIPVEEACTAEVGVFELLLEGTTLLDDFSEEITLFMGLKLAACTIGGAEKGVVEGEASTTLTGGGELTASSESAVS